MGTVLSIFRAMNPYYWEIACSKARTKTYKVEPNMKPSRGYFTDSENSLSLHLPDYEFAEEKDFVDEFIEFGKKTS